MPLATASTQYFSNFLEKQATNKSELHPVAYESHELTDTQTRYSAQECELLAIVIALSTWRT